MTSSNMRLLLFASCVSLVHLAHAQRGGPVVYRYNIGGPSLGGFAAEQRNWITPGNTKTSILNEAVQSSIPGFAIKTHRWAQFSYRIRIPLPQTGVYSCRLYWAETSDFFRGPGKRVFNVGLNGQRLFGIDVFAAAGWRNEYSRTVSNVRVSDALTISLDKVVGDPYLSAVVCTRTAPLQTGLPASFNLNVGGPDIQGFFAEKRAWLSSSNTFTTFTTDFVSGSKPQFFLRTHRWAQISYTIRIPMSSPGRYFCTCFWAETSPFFREDGKRVFNVILNGRRINGIDVHKSVGFLRQYSRSIGNISVGSFLNVRLEKVKGDPYLAGLECTRN